MAFFTQLINRLFNRPTSQLTSLPTAPVQAPLPENWLSGIEFDTSGLTPEQFLQKVAYHEAEVARLQTTINEHHTIQLQNLAENLRRSAANQAGAPDFTKPSLDFSIIPLVDQVYGFQGLKLETPLAEVSGLEFVEQRDKLMVYTRPSDSLLVGLATVDYIEYGFTNERLTHIILSFSGEDNGAKIRDVFSRIYGRGAGTDKLVCWKGEKSDVTYSVRDDNGGWLIFDTKYPA